MNTNIPEEKKEAIINASIEEFAKHEYKHAILENIADKDLSHFIEIFELILGALEQKTDYFRPLTIVDFNVGEKVSIVEIKGTPIVQNYFAGHGIENFSIVEIMKTSSNENFVIKAPTGEIIELDILDAKNLIGIKAD